MNGQTAENDIVWDLDEIKRVINLDKRRTHWLVQNNRIPVRRFGRRLAASRSDPLKLFRERES